MSKSGIDLDAGAASRGLVAIGATLLALTGLLGALGSSPAFAACPNETLRSQLNSSQLPDCRAYELVTPPQKHGWPVEVVSAGASHAVVASLGSFLGSNSVEARAFYEIARKENGWATTPFKLPEGFLSNGGPVAVGSDSTEGVFEISKSLPSETRPFEDTYYTGRFPAETLEELGPPVPTAAAREASEPLPGVAPLRASGDLSRVLFEVRGFSGRGDKQHNYFWPGDTTVQNTGPLYARESFVSLYEYRRGSASHVPALVGVDSEGHQISQCGTALGLPPIGTGLDGPSHRFGALTTEESYNAIATDVADGTSRVFFTVAGADQGPTHDGCTEAGAGHGPHVNELWARTDESVSTDISEPSGANCALCETSENEQREALFQGASEDGAKVVFLSEQKLLPGAGGMSLYEYDFNGAPGQRVTLVAPEALGVARLSEDGSHVYYCSEAVLTGANREGASPTAGAPNLYVTAAGNTAFIGTLAPEDARDWAQEDKRPVDATPDGRFLVFTSTARLTPEDPDSSAQVFEYDAQRQALVRVSSAPGGGGAPELPAEVVSQSYPSQQGAPQLTSISNDGSVVAFQSTEALTPDAAVGYPNVYEYHAGALSLISDGQDRATGQSGTGSELVGMDGSGGDIFFKTADQLVPQDADTQVDLYDARSAGGFAAPAAPAACEGEGCQGGLASAPLLPTISSGSTEVAESLRSQPATVTPTGSTKPNSAALSRAAKLRRALRACRRRPRRSRPACERQARRRFGANAATAHRGTGSHP
jgi:hypothetical protein